MQLLSTVLLVALLGSAVPGAYAAVPAPGDANAGAQKAYECAACHGYNGNSGNPEFPSLAGQDAEYLATQLQAFKDGTRANQIMLGMAAALSPQDMRDIAAYFARQHPGAAGTATTSGAAGARLFHVGDPEHGVPACSSCHGASGQGIPGAAPRLAGQQPAYLRNVLEAWRGGTTWGTSAQAQIMPPIARALSTADVDSLSDYIAGMPQAAAPRQEPAG